MNVNQKKGGRIGSGPRSLIISSNVVVLVLNLVIEMVPMGGS